MPLFNLAYRPTDDAFVQQCISYAHEQFASFADGYLINAHDALPHITVCQFEAPEEKLPQLWERAKKLSASGEDFIFTGPAFRQSAGIHKNYIWAELAVRPDSKLVEEQILLTQMLAEKFGITPLTLTGDDYHPHLTYARLQQGVDVKAIKPPLKSDWEDAYDFYFTLGRSNANGAYLETLYRT
jgi:2'-5' RNA ligase